LGYDLVAKGGEPPLREKAPAPPARQEDRIYNRGHARLTAQPARDGAHVVDRSEGADLERAHPLATNDLASLREYEVGRDRA
jgi:hypothetical protein